MGPRAQLGTSGN